MSPSPVDPASSSLVSRLIRTCIENKLLVFLATATLVFWGILVAPFDWQMDSLPRTPIPVDAIPDIGENQQIVFTEWPGRSPQDIEDQITYPLTSALLGLPEVKTVRSFSMFGFSSIYIIFDERAEFYWTRSRILEKLNSLPSETLPQGVQPQLGPDATALGQVFWYTLEGRNAAGEPSGGWSPQELRSIQDWNVRNALQGVEGVAEVASIGGFVKEYQIDVDPDVMRIYDISLREVFEAVRGSNIDVGARTIEINRADYAIRGLGFLESLDDLRHAVVAHRNNVPITLEQIAEIELGPALRTGALDKAGAEAVGGVVVTRYGENPLAVIQRIKERITQISPGLPEKLLADGESSRVTVVPFYDRTELIQETLGTLEDAVRLQILITIVVVIVMVLHLRSAGLISSMLPLAVLFSFIGMHLAGIDANIVSLSGIAIAIGTIVDMGVVMIENVLDHLEKDRLRVASGGGEPASAFSITHRACTEVGSAVLTAVATTIVGFLPVFTMIGAEGKLFRPLAYTKTFALIGAIMVALTILPPLAHWFIAGRARSDLARTTLWGALLATGCLLPILVPAFPFWAGGLVILVASFNLLQKRLPEPFRHRANVTANLLVAGVITLVLAADWAPLGPEHDFANAAFVLLTVGLCLSVFLLFIRFYPALLRAVLQVRWVFLGGVSLVLLFGVTIWLGWGTVFAWAPQWAKETRAWSTAYHAVPGLSQEFMPPLDEGSFLLMPTTMPHASIGEVADVVRKQDMAIRAIPEVKDVVGKLGRVESPLDPAPISMIETIITYHPEYLSDEAGRTLTFAYDRETDEFQRDAHGNLIPDAEGRAFRQWRDSIRKPDDIWDEIVAAARVPGTTSAPKLQPIAARLVMLQSGVRAPMAFKIQGPDLETIEEVALEVEALLKEVPAVNPDTVFADRVVGQPYLEIDIDRAAIARYGLRIQMVQDVIEVALGGEPITYTVEGRERYPVRVRYLREFRDSIESIEGMLVAAPDGTQIPLRELASIEYARGPQMIRSEDTFLVAYVIFDGRPGFSEIDVVEQAQDYLGRKIRDGSWKLPAGVAQPIPIGNYQNQQRATATLSVVLPLALLLIFVILYLQFRAIGLTLIVFTGIAVAMAGGFIFIWLYGRPWFLDVSLFGTNLRDLFQVGTVNLSVAVWVGFLALFGIATDDGVIMSTYLVHRFRASPPRNRAEMLERVVEGATRRVRPAMITSATTVLALLPILTSTGRGADVMIPMAIPTFGGMMLAILTIFIVPVLYSLREDARRRFARADDSALAETRTSES